MSALPFSLFGVVHKGYSSALQIQPNKLSSTGEPHGGSNEIRTDA